MNRLSRLLLLSLLSACASAPPEAGPPPLRLDYRVADAEFLEAWCETRGFRLGHPSGIHVSHDGSEVLFLRSAADGHERSLWAYDVETATERVLLDAESVLGGRRGDLL